MFVLFTSEVNYVRKLGIIGFLLVVLFVLSCVSLSIYGIVLAFSASVLLGIVVLFIHPLPLVFGGC